MMDEMRRVLVLPAGTEVGLEIFHALHHCKDVELWGAGQDFSNHAPFLYERYRVIPNILEAGWLEALVGLCEREKIHYIFPAYDDVLLALAINRAAIPAEVLAPNLEACELTRSKRKTYQTLSDLVRVPKIYDGPSSAIYPAIVKPDRGQGSSGVAKVYDSSSAGIAMAAIEDGLLCEYLPGEEYTVDCFSDRERGLLFCGARLRNRMRNGIAVNTQTVMLDGIEKIAGAIHDRLSLQGGWFFQIKRALDGQLGLLEVGLRIAGSMSAHRVLGINFPLLTIYETERMPLNVTRNPVHVELDRALTNRYHLDIDFRVLYVDLDDTLVLRGQVNIDALALVFGCINRGVSVKLLTRHAGDLERTLARHRLIGVFDEVIHVPNDRLKSEYVIEPDAIFVDDSFSERQDVASRRGIPTFDCSMIEALTQPRMSSKPETVSPESDKTLD